MPDRDLVQDEIHEIFVARELIARGQRNFGRVSFQSAFATKKDADGLLGRDRKGTKLAKFQIVAPPQKYFVFDHEIEAGPCFVQVGEAVTRPVSEENILEFDLGNRPDFEVKFECVEDSVAIGYFPKWTTEDNPMPLDIQKWIEDTIREMELGDDQDSS